MGHTLTGYVPVGMGLSGMMMDVWHGKYMNVF